MERKRRHNSKAPEDASCTIDELRCLAIDIESDEWEERMLVEQVAEDVFNGIVARYKEEASAVAKDSVWDGKSLHVTEHQVRNLMLFFMRQMHARMRQDFTTIFSQGIEGTALSMSDVACCVASLLIVDMAITDDDIHSFAFTVLPGKRVSLANCPIAKRYLYFTFMAFKSTAPMFKGSMDEFRALICGSFLNPEGDVPPQFALPLHALRNAVLVLANNLTFKSEMRSFYLTALGIEEELRGDLLTQETDMTINIGFQKCDEVGRGANGVVYSCVNTANGKFMALKQLKLKGSANERAIRGEINMLKQLRHNNVIRYYGCSFDRQQGVVSILMEFARKSLRSIVDECGGLSAQLAVHYARKTLEGLCYLHDQHIIHRDIKAANILVTEQGEVKVSDFGTAMLSTNAVDAHGAATATGVKNIQGTPLFLAPEVIHGCVPTESSDIWAFGCTMIEMVSGLNPWWEILQDEPSMPLELLCYRIATATEGPQIPAQVRIDSWLEGVIRSCLSLDPCARPSARQLLATLSMDASLNSFPTNASELSNSSGYLKDISQASNPIQDAAPGEVHSMWDDEFVTGSNAGTPLNMTALRSTNGAGTINTDSLATDASMMMTVDGASPIPERIELQPVPYDSTLNNTTSSTISL